MFPPGVLADDGREEHRHCPECRTRVTAPAFYLGNSIRDRRHTQAPPEQGRRPTLTSVTRTNDGRRPAAARPHLVVTETVTGARVLAVTGPVDREMARRLYDEVETLLRRSTRPIVIDLLNAPGSELAALAALQDIARHPAPPSPADERCESNVRSENDPSTNDAIRFHLVIDPTAAEAWMSIDHRQNAVYPTLSAALEPRA